MLKYLNAALVVTGSLMLQAVSAKIIRVPSDYQAIGSAMINSDYGDSVVVSPGRYFENVTLVQGVVLTGTDPAKCIIDGMRQGPTVYAVSGSEIARFTITNGIDGVLCENASPYIHHNWIYDNEGAGIGAFIALPQIYNNVIYGNRWSGMLIWGAKSLDTRIEQNVIMRNGYSGLTLKGPSRVVVRNNIFMENHEYGIFSDPAAGQSQIVYNNVYKNVMPFNRYTKMPKSNISQNPLFINPTLSSPNPSATKANYFCATKSPMLRRGFGQLDVGLIAQEAVVQSDGDRDGDGILDSKDVCPDLPEDKDGFQDDDGCPDYDNDNDGIPDNKDNCVNDAEDKDGFQDEDGCPDPDNDGDGVLDVRDRCPDISGPASNQGCPLKEIPKLEENFVLEGVVFRTGSSEIMEQSFEKLDVCYEQLKKAQDRRYEISGHTDNAGSDKINIKLSLDRANAVRDYLVNRGIDAKRFVTKGYGSSRPKADNKTAEGKQINRRIEFYHIK